MEWYYVDAGERAGPVDTPGLHALIDAGTVTAATLVWCAKLPDWQPLADVGALLDDGAYDAPARRAICVECGGAFPGDQVIHFSNAVVCSACKPIFFQRIRQGSPTGLAPRYAGFMPRFFAKILDGLVAAAVQMALTTLLFFVAGASSSGIAFEAGSSLMGMVVGFAYTTWFLGRFGATPGKMALGLRVVGVGTVKIGYGRALLRTIAEIISSFILMIGYLMVIYDDERRALHDRLCNTRVVYTN